MQAEEEPVQNNMFSDVPKDYRWKISTGLKFYDTLLGGGLHRGLITQMYGESGTGKTQLCMQLLLGAAKHRISSLYISTEKRLHAQRFQQLKKCYQDEVEQQISMDHIKITHCMGSENDFDSCYLQFLEQIEREKSQGINKFGLLIIDNITRIILDKTMVDDGYDFKPGDVFAKARLQKEFVNALRQNAKIYKFAVLLVSNAAAPIFENSNTIKHYSSDRPVVAALGKSWDSQMDQSMFVSKDHRGNRKMKLVYSPKAPVSQVSFKIEFDGGIFQV